jgi:transketolase
MRTAFIEELVKLARNDNRIFLIVGDLGYSVVEPFAVEFPDRFLNAGVAEQNMTGVAAGLAKEGYIVFTYSIGNFPSLRALEQIRYDICYHELNVNIVSVGAGFAYGSLGASHHATEDMGIMRSLPNMRVYSPADPVEAQLVTQHVVDNPGPSYLRIGKAGEVKVHLSSQSLDISKCNPIVVNKESKVAIIATGSIMESAYQRINTNELMGYDLYSNPSIKPIDTDSIVSIANNYAKIITLEEHQLSTGFGSAIVEIISDLYSSGEIKHYPKVKRVGIRDKFISIGGSQDYLRKIAHLDLEQIINEE